MEAIVEWFVVLLTIVIVLAATILVAYLARDRDADNGRGDD